MSPDRHNLESTTCKHCDRIEPLMLHLIHGLDHNKRVVGKNHQRVLEYIPLIGHMPNFIDDSLAVRTVLLIEWNS